jgi:hypothetical protein
MQSHKGKCRIKPPLCRRVQYRRDGKSTVKTPMAPVTRSHWRLYIAGAGSLKEKRTSAGLELKLQPPFNRSWGAEGKHAGTSTDPVGTASLHRAVDRARVAVELACKGIGS